MDLFRRILDQVKASAHTMQFYFQGEPLLNRQLPEMIAAAHQQGLYTIVSTNAQAITPSMAKALVSSGLSRIIVSIDGFSQESYAAYRVGGTLSKALDGLRYLSEAKRALRATLRIELQVLRLRTNEHEWQWIKRHYKQLGATHLIFKTAQLYDFENGHPLMPTQPRYSRYKKTTNGTYVHKKAYRLLHPTSILHRAFGATCLRLWSGCVITTTGEVLPCCYDKDGQHALGNIAEQSLLDIFHSKRANALRHRVLHATAPIPEMCKNCNR